MSRLLGMFISRGHFESRALAATCGAVGILSVALGVSVVASPEESVADRQSAVVDSAIQKLIVGTSGVTEAYFLGFAGDGSQGVFAKEIEIAQSAFARRLHLAGRSIQLANSPIADEHRPLATRDNLRRAIQGLAAKMNRDEDVLLLFLTSHGSRDAVMTVSQPGLRLKDVSATDIKTFLDEHGIRWRAIIVSACYSGSFIQPLKDEYSLVATAARGDRHSFGCSDERELTYFGEALFRDALPKSQTLREAIWYTQISVAEREARERRVPSEPQLYVGRAMYAKLEEIPFH